jgi:SAM-dependent methyltransferase
MGPEEPLSIRRLNWGCGVVAPFGWVNSDIDSGPGIDVVADICRGLPLANDSFDYAVSIHALPEIRFDHMDWALRELCRVLKPGGVLRLSLPDMDKAIDAYRSGDVDYFLIDDGVVRSTAGKMIVQLTWFGRSRCMFTYEFIEELLLRNGFRSVVRCDYRQTHSPWPGITELDNRPVESLFVEAIK